MATQTRICAVRLPRPLAERFARAAHEAGGRRKAIERMLGQPLPARDWFRMRRIRPPHPVRVSLRLSGETVRRLREVTGTRSLSEAIRLLIYYTFTQGAAASPPRPVVPVASFGASPPVSRPAATPQLSLPPPSRYQIGEAPQPFYRSLQMGFEHLPARPAGQHYACEVRECVNWLPDGLVARCSQHEKAR